MNVRQLMSTDLKTCAPKDSLHTAAQLLWNHDLGSIAVVDGGRLVGLITDRDICMAAYTQGRPLHELEVASAMARELHVVGPEDTLEDALRLMAEHQVRRLPVVDAQRRLKGLLSLNDLARDAVRTKPRAAPKTVLETFAAVCQPRTLAPAAPPRAPLVAAS